MDKLLGFGDIFSFSSGNFNPLLMLPVIMVVFGAVAVFIFGFSKVDNPKFKKLSEHSGGSNKKKRSVTSSAQQSLKQTSKGTLQQKPSIKNSADSSLVKTVSSKFSAATTKPIPVDGTKPKASNTVTKKTATNAAITAKAKKLANAYARKSVTKNAEKPLDIAIDGGEWKTVITKKQKRSTNDLLIQAVVEATAGASAKSVIKKSNVKENNNRAKEQANKTKKASSEQVKQKEFPESPAVVVVGNKAFEAQIETTSIAPVPVTSEADACSKEVIDPLKVQVQLVEASVPANAPETRLASDELGDPTWTEAKALKKSKKRALRE